MSIRSTTGTALLVLALAVTASPAAAADATPPAKHSTAASASRPQRAPKARAAAKRPAEQATPGGRAPQRRLQDIHIEGEIPVPQVLFITARDQRRILDFQHRRYLKTSRQLGETTILPSRIAVIRSHPHDATQENSP